jgi:hypothetical protein
MNLGITIDSAHFTAACHAAAYSGHIDMKKYIRAMGKQVAVSLLHRTAPFDIGKITSAAAAEKVGLEAVSNDMDLLWKTPGQVWTYFPGTLGKRLSLYLQNSELEKFNDVMKDIKKPWRAQPVESRIHHSLRKNGRIRKVSVYYGATPNDAKLYKSKIQSRVGWAKSGWGVAAERLGAKLPAIAKKHPPQAGGFVEVDSRNYHVILRNTRIRIPNYRERVLLPVLDFRGRAMMRDIDRIVKGGKHKWGFK